MLTVLPKCRSRKGRAEMICIARSIFMVASSGGVAATARLGQVEASSQKYTWVSLGWEGTQPPHPASRIKGRATRTPADTPAAWQPKQQLSPLPPPPRHCAFKFSTGQSVLLNATSTFLKTTMLRKTRRGKPYGLGSKWSYRDHIQTLTRRHSLKEK